MVKASERDSTSYIYMSGYECIVFRAFFFGCVLTHLNIEGSLVYEQIVLTLLGAPVVTRADNSAAKLYG